MASLTIHHVVRNQQRFSQSLRILGPKDVQPWVKGAYTVSQVYVDGRKRGVLIRDDKIKWLGLVPPSTSVVMPPPT